MSYMTTFNSTHRNILQYYNIIMNYLPTQYNNIILIIGTICIIVMTARMVYYLHIAYDKSLSLNKYKYIKTKLSAARYFIII